MLLSCKFAVFGLSAGIRTVTLVLRALCCYPWLLLNGLKHSRLFCGVHRSLLLLVWFVFVFMNSADKFWVKIGLRHWVCVTQQALCHVCVTQQALCHVSRMPGEFLCCVLNVNLWLCVWQSRDKFAARNATASKSRTRLFLAIIVPMRAQSWFRQTVNSWFSFAEWLMTGHQKAKPHNFNSVEL